jgi:hypothetical protein
MLLTVDVNLFGVQINTAVNERVTPGRNAEVLVACSDGEIDCIVIYLKT